MGHRFKQMKLHLGPAGDVLKVLQRPWDFIFLDADKRGLLDYYELLVPQRGQRVAQLSSGVAMADKRDLELVNEFRRLRALSKPGKESLKDLVEEGRR